ncbi:MAG: hypothetical protein NZM28_10010 [Fimbriimonadales bacterium]|nr:hypothetical protein [Fimbriimonadales bacterium]
MGLIGGVGAVARFELLRFLRWRVYWRATLGGSATLLLLSVGVLWIAVLAQRHSDAVYVVQVAMYGALATPGALSMWIIRQLIRQMFSDITPRGAVPDLHLTALSALEIALGRLCAAWLLTGLSMLTLLPAPLLMAALVGAPWQWALLSVLTAWTVNLLWGAFEARLQELQSYQQMEVPTRVSSILSSYTLNFWIVYAYILYRFVSGKPLGDSVSLVLGFFPLLTALEAGASYQVGRFVVPAWLVIGGLTLVLTPPSIVAAAVRLDWWTPSAKRFLRWMGGAASLILVAVLGCLIATDAVRAMSDAEKVIFWFTALGSLTVVAWGRFHWGILTPPRTLPARGLRPPWDGVLWEGAMLWSVALVGWVCVGLVSGVWVAPLRLLLGTGYLWTLLTLIHAIEARPLLSLSRMVKAHYPIIPSTRRYEYDAIFLWGCIFVPVILTVLIAAHFLFPASAPLQWFLVAARWTPLGALEVAPLWRYPIYGMYALAVAGLLFWRAVRRCRP